GRRLCHDFAQQLQSLGAKRGREEARARDVTARAIHAGDESLLDRVAAHCKNDRDRRGPSFRRQGRRGAADGSDHRYLTADEIGRERWKLLEPTRCPAVFDGYVPTREISGIQEAPVESSDD